MAQHIKDLVLSLLCLGSWLWCGFDSWPGNFRMLWVQPKKKENKTLDFWKNSNLHPL